ncbi:MAG: hypothetical protein AAGG99_01665 [Pseudomonadota bacterium]
MLKWLSPGDLICDLVGLQAEDENRMVLRMFINTFILGGLGVAVAVWLFV